MSILKQRLLGSGVNPEDLEAYTGDYGAEEDLEVAAKAPKAMSEDERALRAFQQHIVDQSGYSNEPKDSVSVPEESPIRTGRLESLLRGLPAPSRVIANEANAVNAPSVDTVAAKAPKAITADPKEKEKQDIRRLLELTSAEPRFSSVDAAQQERRDMLRQSEGSRLGEILREGLTTSSGLKEYKPDFTEADRVAKKGELGMQEVKEDLALKPEEDALDPTSPLSAEYRKLAGELLKREIPENLSASQLTKILPLLQQKISAEKAKEITPWQQFMRQDKTERLELDKNRESRLVDKFGYDKIQKDELTPKQVETLTQVDNALDDIERIQLFKPAFSTGPMEGRIDRIKSFIGTQEGRRAALQAQIKKALSTYGKAISGAAIAEPEMARLEQQIPQDTDTDEMFAAKFANFKDSLGTSRARILDNIEKSGRDASNFYRRDSGEELLSKYNKLRSPKEKVATEKPSVVPEAPKETKEETSVESPKKVSSPEIEMVTIIAPNGQAKKIPANRVKEAIAAGGKLVSNGR